MYKKKGRKIYNIAEARANLSSIVRDAPLEPAFIGKYGEATAVIVDGEVAEKYLPVEYLDKKDDFGESAIYKYAQEKLKEKKPRGRKVNLSGRIDEILYGIKRKK